MFLQADLQSGNISTHSLTKRLTGRQSIRRHAEKNFNSQPHEEADVGEVKGKKTVAISTHSLTKRLTITERLLNILK